MRQPLLSALALTVLLVALGPTVAAHAALADRQVLLTSYTAAAVASEQCGGKALTMLEESRLGRVIRTESGELTSMTQVADALAANRQRDRSDCGSPGVRARIKQFVDVVLPQLQSGTPLQKPIAGE